MRNITIFALIILIVLLGVSAYFYFSYEKPKEELSIPLYHNINFRFLDNFTKKEIVSDYIIISEDKSILAKNTYYGGDYNKENILVNKSFNIYNINSSSCYYSNKYSYPRLEQPQIVRADIHLLPCGNITISHQGRISYYEPINVTISSKGYISNIYVCLQWTRNILTVALTNYTKSSIPERYKNKVVKCYDIGRGLNNESLLFDMTYKENGRLRLEDKITVYIIDSDLRYDIDSYSFESENKRDIALPDVKYEIE